MILFLYILKDFIKYVVGILILVIFMFIMFDFIHKTTKYFATYEPATKDIVLFYIYQIPLKMPEALPIASLLASVISMIQLARRNEITAMRAAGMGPFKISLPVVAGGIICTIASFLIGEFIVPQSAKRMHYVQQVSIEGEEDDQIMKGARWARQGNRFFSFDDYDPIAKVMRNYQYIDTTNDFKPKVSYKAKIAFYDSQQNNWLASDIKRVYFRMDGSIYKSESLMNDAVMFPVAPKKLKRDRRSASQMNLAELDENITRGEDSGIDTLSLKTDYHVKFAFAFAAFVVSLMGLKFAFASERSVESAKSVLIAVLIGMSYWVLLTTLTALGRQGTLTPFVAAWGANFVITIVALSTIWRASRKA
ncbi:LptF/LptG family permease [Oligoflexaceae bacterium]|nr:LptF/LptG family permease [Oligoflexaceae bacterium]